MHGRVEDHQLYPHLQRIIGLKRSVSGFVGATLVEHRFLEWVKRGKPQAELDRLLSETIRDPVTSVMVVLRREDEEARAVVGVILKNVPHEVVIWGQYGIFPNIPLPPE